MKIILTFVCLHAFSFLFAQSVDKEKLDEFISLIDQNQKGMGSLSIFQDGEEVYKSGFGFSNVEQKVKPNPDTKYRIGSISKTFTAVIVMQLIEEDKLTLSTRLSDYLPEILNAEKITIEHLLRHQSGVFNFTDLPDYTQWMETPISKKELIKKITNLESIFEPGSKSEYSNSNYMLLTLIVEKVDEDDFSQILNRRIVRKLNLQNTYYGGKIQTDQNEAQSYTKLQDWSKATESDLSVPLGAGGIVSTATELNIFINALFKGKLVSKNSLEQMKDLKERFGLGLFQVPFYNKRAYGHTGGIDGFQSNAFYFPEEDVSVAYTSNGVVMPVNDILIGVLSIYFNKPFELPTFQPSYEVTSEELDVYIGVYSNTTFPFKITISKQGSTLIGQATGQPSFPMEAKEEHLFSFQAARLEMEFIPREKAMIFRQGGAEFKLTKE